MDVPKHTEEIDIDGLNTIPVNQSSDSLHTPQPALIPVTRCKVPATNTSSLT